MSCTLEILVGEMYALLSPKVYPCGLGASGLYPGGVGYQGCSAKQSRFGIGCPVCASGSCLLTSVGQVFVYTKVPNSNFKRKWTSIDISVVFKKLCSRQVGDVLVAVENAMFSTL